MLARMVSGLVLAAGLAPAAALACACCADPGARFEQVAGLGDWEISQIAALSARGPARLYVSACGMECVAGIDTPRDSYDVEMRADENGLTFKMSTGKTARGQIVFAWPDAYTWFGTDTNLDARDGAAELYTELRFVGSVTGSGDFAGDGPSRAELVFSGSGNTCITTRSFDGWMLSVRDERADYRLFGAVAGE